MCPPTPQVSACRDSGYDWFEQLLQNVSILMNDKWQQCSFSHVCFLTSVCVDCVVAVEVGGERLLQTC